MNRKNRVKIAEETLNIIDNGGYYNQLGNFVNIQSDTRDAVESSLWYTPKSLSECLANIQSKQDILDNTTSYQVENCTTFDGCKRLLLSFDNVVCLNFASAKNPGGGFLGGSQAQEEALTRASSLYPCLTKHMDMYLANRQSKNLFYSHDMIYSRGVPVFRDDADELLTKPYNVSIITSAAVNAGHVLNKRPEAHDEIALQLKTRARYVLTLALTHGHRVIVLGAWGCGVFRNEPRLVAGIFSELLKGEFKDKFEHIMFAVLDHSTKQQTYQAFKEIFNQ